MTNRDPWQTDAEPAAQPARSGSVAPRPYVHQYIAVPRDTVKVYRDLNGYNPKVDAAKRRSGKGRRRDLAPKHLWLLAALYRLVNAETNLVLIDRDTLAAASGWSARALRDEFKVGPTLPWIEDVERWDRDGRLGWRITLAPVSKTSFLKVPAWWLWTEPPADVQGPDRFSRRADWKVGSPALIAALTVQHVGSDFKATTTYGCQGLATVAGVSLSTMEKARRDAERLGLIALSKRDGGRTAATITVRLLPSEPMSDVVDDWFLIGA